MKDLVSCHLWTSASR